MTVWRQRGARIAMLLVLIFLYRFKRENHLLAVCVHTRGTY
ncbi:MAG: hypothetical protein ACK55Z_13440 [bacterium]